jgi:hypothetical protein
VRTGAEEREAGVSNRFYRTAVEVTPASERTPERSENVLQPPHQRGAIDAHVV